MNGCVIFTGMQRYREMCKFGESFLISEKASSNSELENYILHMYIVYQQTI